MKICVVGGGSTYTPELVDGILRRRDRLPASELVLLDPNHERLEIVGRFARRMCEASGSNLQVRWTADAADALAGSAFVVTQLRVGGQEARHRDELTGRDFRADRAGDDGNRRLREGAADDSRDARDRSRGRAQRPGATLVNFTNPAGLITELLRRHTSLRVVGLCNVPWNMQIEVADALGCDFAEIEIDYVGLNHLSWARGFRVGGEERTAEVLARYRELLVNQAAPQDDPGFAPETISLLGAVPNYYDLYYYETAAMLRHQEQVPTRASQVMADRGPPARALRGRVAAREAGGADGARRRLLLRVGGGPDGRRARRRRNRAGRQRAQRRRDPESPRRRRGRDARAHRPRRRTAVPDRRRCAPTSTRSCARPSTTSCSRSRLR